MRRVTAPADLGTRTFSFADQRRFAELSGDWNPIHVDEVAARRTLFGAPVAHGIHVLLWTLECWLAARPARLTLAHPRASFRKPAFVDREVIARLLPGTDIHLEARSADGVAVDLIVRTDTRVDGEPDMPKRCWPEPLAPDALLLDDATRARGEIEIAIDPARAREMFPACCDALGLAAVAELLATTRIVGMHAPGLHSLFAGLALAAQPSPEPRLQFEVVGARPQYSVLPVRVRGPTWSGTLETFFRPEPTTIDARDATSRVAPDAFAGQRALVVGGTRGLGEAFTRLLTAGGAEVCFTYHRGGSDAGRILAELGTARVAAVPLDVLRPTLALPWAPTHVYYLATPPIRVADPYRPFRADELELMIRYYVTGLHAVIAAALACGVDGRLVVWTPSTTLLDTPRGVAAYCAAKAAMEEMCRQLPALLPVAMHVPRLGRVATDQTAGLIRIPAASAVDVALAQLHTITASVPPPDPR